MSDEWIKIRCGLPDDPDLIAIAAALALDRDAVIGKLVRLWSWATVQLGDRNGFAPGVTVDFIDDLTQTLGFAQALCNVGWLTLDLLGIRIPKWYVYLAKSAKREGETTETAKWTDGDIERIYQAYPRHVGKRAALTGIRRALDRIKEQYPANHDATAWLLDRVRAYADTPVGQSGCYTPYPATWFNQGRYDDDPRTWQQRPSDESRELTVDDVRRQMET